MDFNKQAKQGHNSLPQCKEKNQGSQWVLQGPLVCKNPEPKYNP